jgi:hypothetical protein
MQLVRLDGLGCTIHLPFLHVTHLQTKLSDPLVCCLTLTCRHRRGRAEHLLDVHDFMRLVP